MNKVLAYKHFACKIRIETIKQIAARGFGHLPGCLSVADVLAVLYGDVMNIRPQEPQWNDRDLLIMSKGHAGPAVYTCLALKSYFPMSELQTLNQPGTSLPSHCDRILTKGVDMTAGSLGQGISVAVGAALSRKIDRKDAYTYVILGDGECNEGQVWEALLFAAHHKLDNLIVFVDRNFKQLDGGTEEVLALGNMAQKFSDFGFNALEIDGNDVAKIDEAIKKAKQIKGQPSCIILNTVKGKGVKYIEDMKLNHHIQIDQEKASSAIQILEDELYALEEEMKVSQTAPLFAV